MRLACYLHSVIPFQISACLLRLRGRTIRRKQASQPFYIRYKIFSSVKRIKVENNEKRLFIAKD